MQSQQAPARKAAEKKRHGQSTSGTANTSAQGHSGVQPSDNSNWFPWHHNHAGNRLAPQPSSHRGPGLSQWCNGGAGPRQQEQSDGHREHRHAYHPYHGAGPSQAHKPDGSVGSTHGNQPDSGRRRGTEQPRGSAPRPGRHPVWAVLRKDWLRLLTSTEEPMEVDPPQHTEEPMEVDLPRPQQMWDSSGASWFSALRAQKERRRSARPAPYSSARGLHPQR